MKIEGEGENRFLKIGDKPRINISNGRIVKYLGNYWTNTEKYEKEDCEFIGEVVCDKISYSTYIGIYIKPLYKKCGDLWQKFTEYQEPTEKYFLYPHLLIFPDKMEIFGIYNLHTISEYNIPI